MFDKKRWSKVIENTFRLFGYDGRVTIEKCNDAGQYLIYHSAFGCPFIGFFPKVEEMFTILTMDHRYIDLNKFDKVHKEAIVFDANTLNPMFYSIYNEPEYQRIMITDFMRFKKGDIIYSNEWNSGGNRQYPLAKPIFSSEIFDLDTLIQTLKKDQ